MQPSPPPLLGVSATIRRVIDEVDAVAPTNAKVLIFGESGVGKEIVARMIHSRSLRCHQPLIAINCGGVPETLLESELFGHVRGSFTGAHRDRRGVLELADGGTILLDEVGEMSLRMQGMLLRFLENGEIQPIGSEHRHGAVDVRVLAATNRDLRHGVRSKEFREDLFYRLNILSMEIPPLRERQEDIPILIEHYLETFARVHGLPRTTVGAEAMTQLMDYHWPGNVRELRNVAERLSLSASGRVTRPDDLTMLREISASAAVVSRTPEHEAATIYRRMIDARESFWSAVYEPFMLRDLTRETVRKVIGHGLEQTRGSYRLVAELFNLPSTDYKRFLSFLRKYDCHMPFQKYRVAMGRPPAAPSSDVPETAS